MTPRSYARLSATARESKNLGRTREFSIRHAQAVFAHYLVNLATEFVEGRENGDWTRSLGMLERLRRMHKNMRSDDKAMFADALLETAECFLAEAEHKGD
jgi:hypothetical protein